MANTYRYLPDTEQDKKEMLDFLGMSSIEELFEDIPSELRLKGELTIPEADPEPVLMKKMNQLAARNLNANQYPTFLGAGTYDHYIPSVVDHMISRSEFYTAWALAISIIVFKTPVSFQLITGTVIVIVGSFFVSGNLKELVHISGDFDNDTKEAKTSARTIVKN